MGWFSKKEEVPQIVAAPILPEFPKGDEPKKKDLPELPTFPHTSKNENFNQEMVKSAVGEVTSPGENGVNVEPSKDLHVVEEPRGESTIPPKPSEKNSERPKHAPPIHKGTYKTAQDPQWYTGQQEPIPEIPKKVTSAIPPKIEEHYEVPEYNQIAKPSVKKIEPIFVRIDKFQLAQKNFEQIKDRVKEMESILGKIKDVKSREENELKGWTEDVEKIKSQLSEIDSSVFDQI